MTVSPTTDARELLLSTLKADAGVTGFVAPASIFPNKTPNAVAKPFIRLGPMDARPERVGCWEGGQVTGVVHIFGEASANSPDPETFCNDAAAAVADAIEGLPTGFVDRTLTLPDPNERDVWHGIVFYALTMSSDGS